MSAMSAAPSAHSRRQGAAHIMPTVPCHQIPFYNTGFQMDIMSCQAIKGAFNERRRAMSLQNTHTN